MDSEVFTLGALAILVAGGWLIDLLNQRDSVKNRRDLARQLEESLETIQGARLP
jgi:hypothetical protein